MKGRVAVGRTGLSPKSGLSACRGPTDADGTGSFTVRPDTVSFELEGVSPVPEPEETAAVSLGMALAGLAGRRWMVRQLENRCHPSGEPRL
jgi:hypothetical protein